MASLSETIIALATRAGQECKALHDNIGVLTRLSTTEKASLVSAVNEVDAAAKALNAALTAQGSDIETLEAAVSNLEIAVESFTVINDSAASTSTTYSSSKIASEITAAKQAVKNDLLDGAGAAYDTLKELADLIVINKDAIKALQALAAGHVKYDGTQSLTANQKSQARSNIGAAATTDIPTALKNPTALTIQANGTSMGSYDGSVAKTINITALSIGAATTTQVGDTSTDFVAKFEAALAGTTA